MCCELHLFRPQKVEPVEVEGVEAFLGEVCAWCELGRVCRKCGKREEGILGTASNDTKVFREGSGNWVDLPGSFLVCKDCDRQVRSRWKIS